MGAATSLCHSKNTVFYVDRNVSDMFFENISQKKISTCSKNSQNSVSKNSYCKNQNIEIAIDPYGFLSKLA